MDIKTMQNIKVYNFSESVVILPTRDKEKQYRLAPAVEGVPSMFPMTWDEIEYVNGNSSVFRDGLIEFDADIRAEMYEALRVTEPDKILFNRTIEDIIKKPTMEGLQRIVDARSVGVIERIRGIMVMLKNSGNDVSSRVEKIVNARYKEIARNQFKTDISLTPKDTVVATEVAEDVGTLKAENQEMRNQLTEMKAMMEALMKQNETVALEVEAKPADEPAAPVSEPVPEPTPKPASKPRGRPPGSGNKKTSANTKK